jgi:hypothetical protein
VRFDDVTGLTHHWQRTFVVGINNFKKHGVYVRGRVQGDHVGTAEEIVHQMQEPYQRSPRKSTRHASRELTFPHVTVWHVLRRRLLIKPCRLQLVQALRVSDRRKRTDFCVMLLQDMEYDTLPRLIVCDEATFNLSGKVSRHNVRIWELENPHEILPHERDSLKINVFSAVSVRKIYGPFFFLKETLLREIPILKCCRIGYSHN